MGLFSIQMEDKLGSSGTVTAEGLFTRFSKA